MIGEVLFTFAWVFCNNCYLFAGAYAQSLIHSFSSTDNQETIQVGYEIIEKKISLVHTHHPSSPLEKKRQQSETDKRKMDC